MLIYNDSDERSKRWKKCLNEFSEFDSEVQYLLDMLYHVPDSLPKFLYPSNTQKYGQSDDEIPTFKSGPATSEQLLM